MMAEQQEVQRRINILNHQRAVVERRAKGLSCIDHGFDENCHFQELYEEISIFFDKDIYPRLSTDTIGFWKNIIKGRYDFFSQKIVHLNGTWLFWKTLAKDAYLIKCTS